MKFCVIIPAHNEERFIGKTLKSVVDQTLIPSEVIVVNDNSTDNTQNVIEVFQKEYPFIKFINIVSADTHMPGAKIVEAFKRGLDEVEHEYDIICKFDADLVFPENYLTRLAYHFQHNKNLGLAAGYCYIENNGDWQLENLTRKDHIRGALKAYRKKCFDQIGGLKSSIGWDTIDELLAKFHGWEILTDATLQVKHLKPTGKGYSEQADYLQGEAFYKMRYGFTITVITAAKMAIKKKNLKIFINYLKGYFKAKSKNIQPIVTSEEGKFIRSVRWRGIKEKILN